MIPIVSREVAEKACEFLGIRNWAEMTSVEPTLGEAETILAMVDATSKVSAETFKRGLTVELEHGRAAGKYNITNNHPIATGAIVLAHLDECHLYYERLAVMEGEIDLAKAILSGRGERKRAHELEEAKRNLAAALEDEF